MNRRMDRGVVLKPIRMWIDGQCFELKRVDRKTKRVIDTETAPNSNFDIKTDKNGVLFTTFRLPSVYYKKLLRFRNFDQQGLERNTGTHIIVPKIGYLVITGENAATITQARDEIQAIIGVIRNQEPPAQFISIPVINEEITNNFQKFKNYILTGGEIEGIEESIFQTPYKLHMSVVAFALMDQIEIAEAIKVLKDYKKLILDPLIQKTGPLKIRLSGIDCMQTNLKRVHVLYANGKLVNEVEEFTLQKIVNDLSDFFYQRGLVIRYQENVKIHTTLINTRYRNGENKRRWVKQIPFDATGIMDKYKDFYFGDCDLGAFHLSLLSTVGPDYYYTPLSVIKVSQ